MQIEVKNAKVGQIFEVPHLKIESKKKYLIQGPSGIGKTTLLHLVGGLLPPNSGHVYFQNQDLYAFSDSELSSFRKKNVAFVFQKLNLIDHLTAYENILLGARPDLKEKISENLDMLGLSHKAKTMTGFLSLGEQQRVAVARCLAQGAQIILADEPTSSLDDENSKKIIEFLITEQSHATVLVVSHDHRLAEHFDYVIPFRKIIL